LQIKHLAGHTSHCTTILFHSISKKSVCAAKHLRCKFKVILTKITSRSLPLFPLLQSDELILSKSQFYLSFHPQLVLHWWHFY